MAEQIIPFGPLQPDQPGFVNDGVLTALNVIPKVRSYGPFHRLSVVANNALTGRVLTAISVRDTSNDTFVYAADATAIYEMLGGTFTDESKAGGYATDDNDSWEAAVWTGRNVANGRVIFTNYQDAVQSIAIGGGAAGAFADMITSTRKPTAKHVGVIHRFVVLGFTNDATDGERSSRVWWSAIDDERDFDPSAATQCDYEDLADGGIVRRIVGGNEYGLVFQNAMVRAMRYTGGDTKFEMWPINYAPGTPIPRSVIAHRGKVFYIAEDGFMGLNGVNVEPIGNNRVDRYFWDQFDVTNRRYVSAAVDPVNKIVAWAFPGTDAVGNLPNRILMCKWDELKWSEAQIDTDVILSSETQGYTLETLDNVGTNIDNATLFDESLDSDKWKGGSFRFAAFDQSHRLSFFTGPTLAATIVTGDMQSPAGRRSQVNAVRPLVDGGDARVSVASRQRLRDSISYGSASDMNAAGLCRVRASGQYHRFRLSLSSSTSWSHVQGLGVEYVDRGRR